MFLFFIYFLILSLHVMDCDLKSVSKPNNKTSRLLIIIVYVVGLSSADYTKFVTRA